LPPRGRKLVENWPKSPKNPPPDPEIPTFRPSRGVPGASQTPPLGPPSLVERKSGPKTKAALEFWDTHVFDYFGKKVRPAPKQALLRGGPGGGFWAPGGGIWGFWAPRPPKIPIYPPPGTPNYPPPGAPWAAGAPGHQYPIRRPCTPIGTPATL
jgi:hypothetical protein